MKKKITMLAAALLVAGPLAATVNAPAQAAITTIGQCYTAVTNACNKKKSDEAIAACNNNGHDQCDKQFGSSKNQTGNRPGSLKLGG